MRSATRVIRVGGVVGSLIQTRRALLAALAALTAAAGCGGARAPDVAPKEVEREGSAVCSGKPRYCAGTDVGRTRQPP
jgi:hypothetical protein